MSDLISPSPATFAIQEGGCWVWVGAGSHQPTVWLPGRRYVNARHLIFESYRGRTAKRRLIKLCDGPEKCVNPQHWADDFEDVFAWRQRPEGECRVWTGQVSDGYPVARFGGELIRVHRYAWERVNGPMAASLQADHLCNTPLCVRYEHLRAATVRQNVLADHSATAPGINFRKTHCLRGHPFDAENTYVDPRGYRCCRICRRERRRGAFRG